MEFYENLKTARIRAGLTQQQVANALGKCQQQIADWEKGRFIIKIPDLIRFCQIVGSDPNEILGFSEMEVI